MAAAAAVAVLVPVVAGNYAGSTNRTEASVVARHCSVAAATGILVFVVGTMCVAVFLLEKAGLSTPRRMVSTYCSRAVLAWHGRCFQLDCLVGVSQVNPSSTALFQAWFS